MAAPSDTVSTDTAPTADVSGIDPDDVAGEYQARGLDAWSDRALVDAVAAVLARPREEPPDSFVLHAPLELLARTALLPHVSPDTRRHARHARHRIVAIAAGFEAYSDPAPDAGADDLAPEDASGLLVDALRTGDLSGAERAGRALGRGLDAGALTTALGDTLVASLAAAAHGPIFLHHLPRAAASSAVVGAMLGTLAREVARNPGWALTWQEDLEPSGGADLGSALARTPVLGSPGSDFIHPLMMQAQDSGLAAEVVGGSVSADLDIDHAARAILRVASASMLLDDTDHAPYGWSHCLTIPQGVLATLSTSADPLRGIAIAGTHVVGFRAALAAGPLVELDGPAGHVGDDLLVTDRARVAPDPERWQAAVDFAAGHEDAHLTKYLVSCTDAARSDPDGADQHLAAAVHLADWWHRLAPA